MSGFGKCLKCGNYFDQGDFCQSCDKKMVVIISELKKRLEASRNGDICPFCNSMPCNCDLDKI